MKQYHRLSVEEALREQQSSRTKGLSTEQISERRMVFGWNEFEQVKGKSLIWTFLRQFKSWLVIILLVAAGISFFTNHIIDTYVILVVVLVNAIIGFLQEVRAERAMKSLRKMLVPQSKVIRQGRISVIPARNLVPGDILIVEEGENLAADARILDAKNFKVNESALTGESFPVNKSPEQLPDDTSLADRTNMLWKGTFVSSGYGIGMVTAIGGQTELGKIAQSLTGIKEGRTNFQRKTDRLARQMAMFAIGSTSVLFIIGYFFSDFELADLLMVSLAMMVAAVPEGLPAVLAIVLAIGSNRMARRNAIVREITSVETLGAVTTIITDKTGTLTQNTLTARKIKVFGEKSFSVSGNGWSPEGDFYQNCKTVESSTSIQLEKLLQVVATCNNSVIKHNKQKDSYELIGDPTEGALLAMAKKAGPCRPNGSRLPKKIDDFPFSSVYKLRASLCEFEGKNELFVVGAPEKVLKLSDKVLTSGGVKKLEDRDIDAFQSNIDEWSGEAMRVIGVAFRQEDSHSISIDPDHLGELTFLGIVGIMDPLRPGVTEAVHKCKQAGIRVIMATGDHINTAIALAKASGIIDKNEQEPLAFTEKQLEKLDQKEFQQVIKNIRVFARLSPMMKLKIASNLQASGELIAMTGDGVNDAPALKKADVGISMGVMGTDVAREASKMVLADDNFATIVNAIEEGRIVFNNARQTSFFLVTTNFAEVATMIILIVMGYPLPLTAIQILWLNLVTDGFGDLALAAEKGHGDELLRKPMSKNEKILNREVLPFLLIMTVIMVGLCISIYFWQFDESIEKVRTAVFVTMASTQLFNLFNMRSLYRSAFKIGFLSNKWVLLTFFISLAIMVLIIEVQFFQEVFDFVPLDVWEFTFLVIVSSLVLWVGEIYKLFGYRKAS